MVVVRFEIQIGLPTRIRKIDMTLEDLQNERNDKYKPFVRWLHRSTDSTS